MKTVKWAMVGTGLMANLILKDFALSEGSELVALVSRDAEKAQAKLAAEGVEARVITFEQALTEPEIDVIYVATPHASHFDLAKRALEAGKHVLVEKAFTMDAAEARELKRIAQQQSRFLMEAMWTKFQPLLIEVKRLVDAGEIGELKLIEGNFGRSMTFDNSHRLFNFEQGGGSTLDQGVYTTNLAVWFAGSKVAKQTTTGELFSNGADASAYSLFEFENGVTAVAFSSLVASLGTEGRLVGNRGSIQLLDHFWFAEEARVVRTVDGEDQPAETIRMPRKGAGYTHMIEAVSSAVREGKLESEQHPLDFTIEVMELLDEARRQINSR